MKTFLFLLISASAHSQLGIAVISLDIDYPECTVDQKKDNNPQIVTEKNENGHLPGICVFFQFVLQINKLG